MAAVPYSRSSSSQAQLSPVASEVFLKTCWQVLQHLTCVRSLHTAFIHSRRAYMIDFEQMAPNPHHLLVECQLHAQKQQLRYDG